jgi:hypothetical protein
MKKSLFIAAVLLAGSLAQAQKAGPHSAPFFASARWRSKERNPPAVG